MKLCFLIHKQFHPYMDQIWQQEKKQFIDSIKKKERKDIFIFQDN